MKAAVLLCLLHAAFIESQNQFAWPDADDYGGIDPIEEYGCESNRAMCGCCLMLKKMKRFEVMFDMTMEGLHKELSIAQMNLNQTRDIKHTAFSVALRDTPNPDCLGPFSYNISVSFNHIFFNMEGSYSVQTGIFTVPCSGVYSLSLTLYSYRSASSTSLTCAQLQVNGQEVSSLPKTNGPEDREDSLTEVIAIQLQTGDQVSVSLPAGCVVCDDNRHLTTFTGFLIYPTE